MPVGVDLFTTPIAEIGKRERKVPHLRIADTFTDGLARLTSDEQKAVKTTAFDLQINPANSGMQLHRLNKAKDKNFWSVRISSDLRLLVHKSDESLLTVRGPACEACSPSRRGISG